MGGFNGFFGIFIFSPNYPGRLHFSTFFGVFQRFSVSFVLWDRGSNKIFKEIEKKNFWEKNKNIFSQFSQLFFCLMQILHQMFCANKNKKSQFSSFSHYYLKNSKKNRFLINPIKPINGTYLKNPFNPPWVYPI